MTSEIIFKAKRTISYTCIRGFKKKPIKTLSVMDALPFEEDKYKIDAYFHPCLFQNDLKNKADISMLEGLGKSEIVICI